MRAQLKTGHLVALGIVFFLCPAVGVFSTVLYCSDRLLRTTPTAIFGTNLCNDTVVMTIIIWIRMMWFDYIAGLLRVQF